MRAVRVHEFGGPEVMILEEVERPVPADDQVLIRVQAAGVNWSDTQRRSSEHYPVPTVFPHTVGQELVGTIEEVGSAVTRHREGDTVFALPDSGAYADYALAAEHELIPVPAGLDPIVGLSLVVHGLTALAILKDAAPLRPGDTILIQAAGGGVGLMAVQLAKLYGSKAVIALASTPEKREVALDHGADVALDPASDDWQQAVMTATEGRGVDVILECTGGRMAEECLALAADFGRIVLYGNASNEPTSLNLLAASSQNLTMRSFFLVPYLIRPGYIDEALGELARLVSGSELKPLIGGRYGLEEAQRMHELMEERKTVGKLLVIPS